jgi:hypothetical protein
LDLRFAPADEPLPPITDGLAGHHELPHVNGYPFHLSEQGVIVTAGIKDQRPSAGESRFKSFMIC